MKREFLALTACLATTSVLMVACTKEQPLGTGADLPDSGLVSLEKDFGGYTTSDETPMFSDEEVIVESVEDGNVSDPVSYEAAANLAAATGIKAYEVRLTWGLLEGDSTARDLLDWSGRVSVSRGVLAVLRVLRFERELQGDRLHLPRTSRRELAFTSYTDTHYDGLLLLIVDTDSVNTPGEFSIQTGSYARRFTFDELESLNLVEPVDSDEYAVSIVGRSQTANRFNGGFLAGGWVKSDDQGGRFSGRWIDSEGTNVGALHGIWGVRRNGEKLLFGKYLGLNGESGGLLAGHWQYDRDERSGVFDGTWFNRDRQVSGALAGNFRIGTPGDGRGFFHGRWFIRR